MTPPNQSRRLLLACNFVSGRLREVAERLRWNWQYSIGPEEIDGVENVWRLDPEHTFHVFQYADYPVCYCIVDGPRAADVLQGLRGELVDIDLHHITEAFDRSVTIQDWRSLTYALGICAGDEVEEAIASRIRLAFAHEHPEVRLSAIDAAFITGWDMFRQDLERLGASDPDEDVRDTALNGLAEWGLKQRGASDSPQAPPNTNK
jgi:hypothetical protein